MPELPEVETTRRGIAPHICGQKSLELKSEITDYAGRFRKKSTASFPVNLERFAPPRQIPAVPAG